jgi:hypothetical protein
MATVSQPAPGGPAQVPQPVCGKEGGTDPGPRHILLDQQNPDILTPPSTDAGTIPNLKFPFSLAHNRLQEGGWARQVTMRELPIATTLAGVNMRLNPGAIRELHWHPTNDEWQYYIEGSGRMTVFAAEAPSCPVLAGDQAVPRDSKRGLRIPLYFLKESLAGFECQHIG